MDPKSGKPLRLFNPLSLWTGLALKSGEAMLAAAQAAITRPKPKVAVIHAADAPPRKAARSKSKPKARTARKSASSGAKRRGR